MRFDKKTQDDLESAISASYSDEDYAKAKQTLKTIVEQQRTDTKDNSLQIDKHLVWFSGGALALLTNIFLSNKVMAMEWRELLVISFIAFGTSILFVVTSYRKALKSLNCSLPALVACEYILEYQSNSESELKKQPEERKRHRTNYENSIAKAILIAKWVPFCNGIAYWGFIVGMVAFLGFGFINILGEVDNFAGLISTPIK